MILACLPLIIARDMVELVRGGRMCGIVLDAKLVTEEELEKMAEAWEGWWPKEDSSLAMMQGEGEQQVFLCAVY
ncbi:hypothetical protein F4820DRAFT_65385 [Hypoxylon rubiginosum]|uniref:Uncharacterized protein n=1 Tax=Hypoxylon rubiginosum TaxID=110542 RepID=A0ACB9YQ43_9PEZI|nr:hypothetical protein F4820DRAFT_65385 [Hypoxylon rubiginosum]